MSSQVPFLSRLFGVFIFALCGYGIFYSTRWTTFKTRNTGKMILEEALSRSDLETARNALELIETTSRATDLLPIPPFAPYSEEEYERASKKIQVMINALESLLQEEFQTKGITQYLLSLPSSERKEFAITLRQLIQSAEEMKREETLLQHLKQDEEQTWIQIRLLKKDFRSLLNLPNQLPEDTIELYTAGFLEGLPVVEELPSVASPQGLRAELTKHSLALPNVSPQVFRQSIGSLKKGFSKTLTKLDDIDSQRKSAESTVLEAESLLKTVLEKAKKGILLHIHETLKESTG